MPKIAAKRLYVTAGQRHCVAVFEFRVLRRTAGLTQQEFAALLDVSVNSLRMWDSGLRSVPAPIIQHARGLVARHARESEPLALAELARELGVHVQTLRAAVRTGRLQATFSTRSVFGRPLRRATRAAGREFLRESFRRRNRRADGCPPLISIPRDYDLQLKLLRSRLGMTQQRLAEEIGAAGKAVIYQWESRKRTPSPLFWRLIERLSTGDGPSAVALRWP